MAERTSRANHSGILGCSRSRCPATAGLPETRCPATSNLQAAASPNEGLSILSSANPPQRPHLSTLQSQEPLPQPQEAKEKARRVNNPKGQGCASPPSDIKLMIVDHQNPMSESSWVHVSSFSFCQMPHFLLFKCT